MNRCVKFLLLLIAMEVHLYADLEFPESLAPLSSLLPIFADSCVEALDGEPLAAFPHECLETFRNDESKTLLNDLPARLIDWGSGGLLGTPWRYKNEACNEFFISLFKQIASSLPKVNLTPHDLFHAHAILYGQKDRLALVFHAKEYPSDLERGKNHYQIPSEEFTSTDVSFRRRNFIYLSHVDDKSFKNNGKDFKLINKVYSINETGACKKYFTDASTLSEKDIAASLIEGKIVGDVNVFLPKNLNRIKYQFYPGYSLMSGKFFEDLEGYEVRKTLTERMLSNYAIDNVIRKQQGQPLIYWLTGQ
jgi:hypothetical protein